MCPVACLLERFHLLFFENIFTREVWCGGIAHDPDGNWMAQVARNQADMWNGKLLHTQYLIHDRDPLFQGRFPIILKSVGCRIKLIQPRCPEQNGYIESFIKTFKTECLNHVILQSEAQLRYVVNEFLIYYNRERPHSGLGGKNHPSVASRPGWRHSGIFPSRGTAEVIPEGKNSGIRFLL